MRTDLNIKEDVLAELKWKPDVRESQIGVTVNNGIVTLTGTVDSYAKKREAEEAAKSISGVRAVAEDIEVKYGPSFHKTDTEIAASAANALTWSATVPKKNIDLKVENGRVDLTGEVEWGFQRDSAKRAVEDLLGVKYVNNLITVKQQVDAIDVKDKIAKAFERSASIDARNISVKTDGHKVKLTGKVHSWNEKEEARKTAFRAPGVWSVDNELEIEY